VLANDVRNVVAVQIRQELPQDINEPIVQRLDFAGGPIDDLRCGLTAANGRRPAELPR